MFVHNIEYPSHVDAKQRLIISHDRTTPHGPAHAGDATIPVAPHARPPRRPDTYRTSLARSPRGRHDTARRHRLTPTARAAGRLARDPRMRPAPHRGAKCGPRRRIVQRRLFADPGLDRVIGVCQGAQEAPSVSGLWKEQGAHARGADGSTVRGMDGRCAKALSRGPGTRAVGRACGGSPASRPPRSNCSGGQAGRPPPPAPSSTGPTLKSARGGLGAPFKENENRASPLKCPCPETEDRRSLISWPARTRVGGPVLFRLAHVPRRDASTEGIMGPRTYCNASAEGWCGGTGPAGTMLLEEGIAWRANHNLTAGLCAWEGQRRPGGGETTPWRCSREL